MLLELLILVGVLGLVHPDEGYFWHVADYHYDTTYWTDKRSCNTHFDVSSRGVYGDPWCDSPWRLVQDSIDAISRVRSNVDFLLWTGDNVAHIKDEYTSRNANMAVLTNITQALKTAFHGVKVYATMGNHDWFPSDQYPAHNAYMYNATAELWKDWIVEEDQLDNFRKAGYYTVKTAYGLRIIGLNSILYYKPNKEIKNLKDPAGQFAWLTSVLEAAKQNTEKVLLTTHIPPGLKVPGKFLWYVSNFNDRFLEIVNKYQDVITGMHFGHDHADEIRISGTAGVPIFIAPSVTPWRYKNAKEEDHRHNPAARLVRYNRQTGVILDIHQYYMDLVKSNKDKATSWKVAYKATDSYDVEDLSARSVQQLVKKMEKEGKYLDKYIRHHTVLANGDATVKNCDATCRAEYVCAMTQLTEAGFNTCVPAHVSGGLSVSGSYQSVLVSCALVIASLARNLWSG